MGRVLEDGLGKDALALDISYDDMNVYVGSTDFDGTADDNSVVLFKRSPGTGVITFVESQRDGGATTA